MSDSNQQAGKVYVLMRGDQNQHGYVDVTIDGIVRSEVSAKHRRQVPSVSELDSAVSLLPKATARTATVSWHVASHLVSNK